MRIMRNEIENEVSLANMRDRLIENDEGFRGEDIMRNMKNEIENERLD